MILTDSQRHQIHQLRDMLQLMNSMNVQEKITYLDAFFFPKVLETKWIYLQNPSFRGTLENKLTEFSRRAPNLVAKWREIFDIEIFEESF